MIKKLKLEIENKDCSKCLKVDLLRNDVSAKRISDALDNLKIALSLTLLEKNVQEIKIHIKTNESFSSKSDSPLGLLISELCGSSKKSVIHSVVEDIVQEKVNGRVQLKRLSHREQEIAGFIKKGYSTDVLSRKMKISPKTVKTHRNHIFKKLQIHKTAELIDWMNRNRV